MFGISKFNKLIKISNSTSGREAILKVSVVIDSDIYYFNIIHDNPLPRFKETL